MKSAKPPHKGYPPKKLIGFARIPWPSLGRVGGSCPPSPRGDANGGHSDIFGKFYIWHLPRSMRNIDWATPLNIFEPADNTVPRSLEEFNSITVSPVGLTDRFSIRKAMEFFKLDIYMAWKAPGMQVRFVQWAAPKWNVSILLDFTTRRL